MTVLPLGDQAVLCYFPDEPAAVRFAAAVRAAGPAWLFDVVPAYASVGVFFDPERVSLSDVMKWVEHPASGGRKPPVEAAQQAAYALRSPVAHTIPVCYEMQLDLDRVAEHTGLTADRVIELHQSREYTVYAVGFVPGFPYLGYLPMELCGVGRLPSPRVRVDPGSVGLTGRQTGIYPLPRPGGWNIIGRTPLVLVDVADGFFPIRVGDAVRFTRIDASEYRKLDGERLGQSTNDPPMTHQ
jgi:inhibitor of KinA